MELFYQKNLQNDWVLIGQIKPKIIKIKPKRYKINTSKYQSLFIKAMDGNSIPKKKIKID
jgi:hypothetical protein